MGIRRHLTYANVVSTLCLFILLGGTAWAVAANSIGTAQLKNGAVTNPKIAANAVNGQKIVNGSVGGVDLANNAVNGPKIFDGSIAAPDLADNSVNGAKIADGSVAGADLADNSVNTAKIADHTVYADDLTFNAVNSSNIVNHSITGDDIGSNQIIGQHVAPDSLDASDIQEETLKGFVRGQMLDLDTPADGVVKTVSNFGPYRIRGLCTQGGQGTSFDSTGFTLRATGPAGSSEITYSVVENDTTDKGNEATGKPVASNVETVVLSRGILSNFARLGGTLTLRTNAGDLVQILFSITMDNNAKACHIWGTQMVGP